MRQLIERLQGLNEASPSFYKNTAKGFEDRMFKVFGASKYDMISKADHFIINDFEVMVPQDIEKIVIFGDSSDLRGLKSRAEAEGLDVEVYTQLGLAIISMG